MTITNYSNEGKEERKEGPEMIYSKIINYKGRVFTLSVIRANSLLLTINEKRDNEKQKVLTTTIDLELLIKLHKETHRIAKEIGLELKP